MLSAHGEVREWFIREVLKTSVGFFPTVGPNPTLTAVMPKEQIQPPSPDQNREAVREYKGFLEFYSETGTEGGFWAFQDERFIFPPNDTFRHEQYSYEGLHVLENGDRLTIYSPDAKEVVWEGEISLKPYHIFTEDAFGVWIHADQEGVDRKTWAKWFFESYPAKLIAHPKSTTTSQS